jgi:hypothetical protein
MIHAALKTVERTTLIETNSVERVCVSRPIKSGGLSSAREMLTLGSGSF